MGLICVRINEVAVGDGVVAEAADDFAAAAAAAVAELSSLERALLCENSSCG